MKLERQILITPAYDKRDDNPSKNYGIGSCRIMFAVIGKKGAVTISFGTNWFLQSTLKEYKEIGIHRNTLNPFGKEPFKTKIDLTAETRPIQTWSLDWHSKKPQFKGHDLTRKDCEFTKGKCYCDGTCMGAEKYLDILLQEGSQGVFKHLENDYKSEFYKKKVEL